MNDNYIDKQTSISNKKNIFTMIINQLFHEEPRNRQDLLKIIRGFEQNQLIDYYTFSMLEGTINIVYKKVKDIMTPKSQIVAIKQNESLNNCINIITQSSYSRFPVINENKDHVEGVLIAKDFFSYIYKKNITFNIKEILHQIIVVPENKRIDRMLKEFRLYNHHIAIVINEFGDISGLITIEDILKLIVGNIKHAQNDKTIWKIDRIDQYNYSISALIPIEEFNKIFNTHFDSNEIDTIGGLIMQKFGHLPLIGENINVDKYTFTVSATDSRRIIKIIVKTPKILDINISNDT